MLTSSAQWHLLCVVDTACTWGLRSSICSRTGTASPTPSCSALYAPCSRTLLFSVGCPPFDAPCCSVLHTPLMYSSERACCRAVFRRSPSRIYAQSCSRSAHTGCSVGVISRPSCVLPVLYHAAFILRTDIMLGNIVGQVERCSNLTHLSLSWSGGGQNLISADGFISFIKEAGRNLVCLRLACCRFLSDECTCAFHQ